MDFQKRAAAAASDRLMIANALRDHPLARMILIERPDRLRVIHDLFRRDFPGEPLYAMKANPDDRMITALVAAGMVGIDAASLTEVAQGFRLKAGRIFFNNPAKTREEIRVSYERYGVRDFTIDCRQELEKIAAVIPLSTVTIAVRFIPPKAQALSDLSTKFGAPADAAVSLLKLVAATGARPALSFHPGWQLSDHNAHAIAMRQAVAIAEDASIGIDYLNIGGGFPTRPGVDMVPYLTSIVKAKQELPLLRNLPLFCEPGGVLAAPYLDIAVRVVLRKEDSVYLGDGIYGAFYTLPQLPFDQPYRVVMAAQEDGSRDLRQFTAYGPTCDSIDCFPRSLLLPETIAADDWIIFEAMGAYSAACASAFNGFRIEDAARVAL